MYEKIEKYTVNSVPQNNAYEILGEFKDDVHNIKIRVLIDIFTFKIVEATTIDSGVPFDICHEGVFRIKNVIGTSIGPGFSKVVREKLMGPNGCTHLGELMLGAVKAFIQAASRNAPDWVDEEYYASLFKKWTGIYSDQCIYFSQQYKSQEELQTLLNKKRGLLDK